MVGHQHAGQLFGVQTGLDIDLGPLAGLPEMEAAQRFLAAQTVGQQGVVGAVHGVGWDLGAGGNWSMRVDRIILRAAGVRKKKKPAGLAHRGFFQV